MNTELVKMTVRHEGHGYDLWQRDGVSGGETLLAKDLDVGRWLDFDRPRDLRKLIVRYASDLGPVYRPEEDLRATVARKSRGRQERPFYLAESQVLFLAAKSETPRANQVLRILIAVYLAARRGELPGQQLDFAALRAELRADIRAEVRAEIRAELRQRMASDLPVQPSAPAPSAQPDLAAAIKDYIETHKPERLTVRELLAHLRLSGRGAMESSEGATVARQRRQVQDGACGQVGECRIVSLHILLILRIRRFALGTLLTLLTSRC
jgi:hypothetical protein